MARLARDVSRVLKTIARPTPLKDIAKRMMDHDPNLLKQTRARLSDKEAATISDDEVKERCLQALIRRLQRAIGNEKAPGQLAPFVEKIGNGRAMKWGTPYRLIPIGDMPPPSQEEIDEAMAEQGGSTVH